MAINNFIRIQILAIIIILGNLTPVFSADFDPENINTAYLSDDTNIIDLLPHSLSSIENTISSIDDIYKNTTWNTIKSDTINLGMTSSALWITTSITSNKSLNQKQFYLRFSNPELSDIKVYQDKNLISEPGQRHNFNNRVISLPEFVVPITFTKNSITTLTIRITSSGSLRTGITLHSGHNLFSIQNKQSLMVGGYYGLASLLCLLFFGFYIFSKENIYLWVSLSLGSLIMLQLNIDGFLYQYGYQEQPNWFFSFLLIPTIIAYITTHCCPTVS
ncbi:hypothetical protein A9Q81_17635 [Gammaproteobacteria bacterium 42_54_T18]|nr:hypothetical protein A9Q81_17635 [Gammaproteobacteria bacterium 42_54_T18]